MLDRKPPYERASSAEGRTRLQCNRHVKLFHKRALGTIPGPRNTQRSMGRDSGVTRSTALEKNKLSCPKKKKKGREKGMEKKVTQMKEQQHTNSWLKAHSSINCVCHFQTRVSADGKVTQKKEIAQTCLGAEKDTKELNGPL